MSYLLEVEKRLEELLQRGSFSSKKIKEAALYSMDSGKKIRPQLLLFLGEKFGVSLEKSLDPACAIEMVHSFSLIHDDLPCMDDDAFRRGKPSTHKAFGEAIALLTGDFLLAYAFQILSEAPHISDSQKVKLVQVLGKASGNQGMIAGQSLDLSSVGKILSKKVLIKMHYYKTACLISTPFQFLSILANTSLKESILLKKLGVYLGIAYQIQDDLLDVFSKKELLGKPLYSDKEKRKPTAVSILGVSFSQKTLEKLQRAIRNLSKKLHIKNSPFYTLLEEIFHRSY